MLSNQHGILNLLKIYQNVTSVESDNGYVPYVLSSEDLCLSSSEDKSDKEITDNKTKNKSSIYKHAINNNNFLNPNKCDALEFILSLDEDS